MKYMVKSKILATFCAGLLTVSTGIQAAERLDEPELAEASSKDCN